MCIRDRPEPSLGTDDFGYFSDAAPGCYYYIGVGSEEKGFTFPNHNPRFAADPELSLIHIWGPRL